MPKPKIAKDKYFNAILYFLNKQIKYPTKTKLFKLLYYLDFDYFERYDKAVTNDKYKKMQFGPVPITADSILSMMQKAKVELFKSFHHKLQLPTTYAIPTAISTIYTTPVSSSHLD